MAGDGTQPKLIMGDINMGESEAVKEALQTGEWIDLGARYAPEKEVDDLDVNGSQQIDPATGNIKTKKTNETRTNIMYVTNMG